MKNVSNALKVRLSRDHVTIDLEIIVHSNILKDKDF